MRDNMQDHLLSAAQRMRGERLGRRQYDRLCERLLAYTEAKAWIKAQGLERGHEKRAISLLYARSGGTKWLTPAHVQKICEEART